MVAETEAEAEAKHNDSEEGLNGEDEVFSSNHDFMMASSLLEDAADWFAAPPSPPPSSLDCVAFDPDFKLTTHDMAACYAGEMWPRFSL